MTYDITIKQGKTFSLVVRWTAGAAVFKPITLIEKTVPMRVTAAGHGMVSGAVAAIVGVVGMTEANAKNKPPRSTDYTEVAVIDANTLSFIEIDPTDFSDYKVGGYVRYYTPVDTTGFIARMKIKSKPGGEQYASLVSPTDIVFGADGLITVTMSATATALLDFNEAQYDLEVESPGGVVKEIISGKVTLVKEITA